MSRARAFSAVVFDLDGLMFNTEQIYERVGVELLGRRGLECTRPLLDAMMGRPSAVAYQVMIDWHDLDDTIERLDVEGREIFAGLLDEHLAPMPGLVDLLACLERAALPKAIATSSSRRYLERLLSRYELEPRFCFTLTSDDVRQGKPHPEIYELAARHHGVAPGQMLVLEDSEAGATAAHRAGAFVVAVPGEPSREHDFSMADLVINGLGDARLYEALGL